MLAWGRSARRFLTTASRTLDGAPLAAVAAVEATPRRQQRCRNPALEEAARANTLKVAAPSVPTQWDGGRGGVRTAVSAWHYHVFPDVMIPVGALRHNLCVAYKDGLWAQRGNILRPAQVLTAPYVTVPGAESDRRFSLALVAPDSFLLGKNAKQPQAAVLWLVTDIPGDNVGAGTTVVPYTPPMPLQGTGVHRFAFVLAEQTTPEPLGPALLTARALPALPDFKGLCAARGLVPTGLVFFQAAWDASVNTTYASLHKGAAPPIADARLVQ